MNEMMLLSSSLFLAWGWLGLFYAGIWLIGSLIRESMDKRNRAFMKGIPWDDFDEEERHRANRRWRKTRWRGLKHYVVGMLLLAAVWAVVIWQYGSR